jgi:hypothetical protein
VSIEAESKLRKRRPAIAAWANGGNRSVRTPALILQFASSAGKKCLCRSGVMLQTPVQKTGRMKPRRIIRIIRRLIKSINKTQNFDRMPTRACAVFCSWLNNKGFLKSDPNLSVSLAVKIKKINPVLMKVPFVA